MLSVPVPTQFSSSAFLSGANAIVPHCSTREGMNQMTW